MTPDEFKKIQSDLGWTNPETAEELEVSLSTVEKWRSGLREIPAPIEKLIGMILENRKSDPGREETAGI